MTRDEHFSPLELAPLTVFGLILLCIAMFTPDIGSAHGTTFFHAASQTSWSKFGDWPAAWCSCKIIMAAIGGFMLAHVLCTCLSRWLTREANWLILPAILCAGCLFWVGCFYLVKALL